MKRKYWVPLVIFSGLFCLRGPLYRAGIQYEIAGYRVTRHDCAQLVAITNPAKFQDIQHIQQEVADKLIFARRNGGKSAADVLENGQANCIGYATVAVSMVHCFLGDNYQAKHAYGRLYFMGIDIHPFFDSPFFKDHDIVVIENLVSGDTYAIDPSLYDYTGIRWVSLKETVI